MVWAALASTAINAAGSAASAPAPPMAPDQIMPEANNGAASIGGINIGKTKGVDLSDPVTAVMTGGGVILFGAVLLAAVRK
ncbi:MAG: hypothetical protein ACRBBW_21340 [Cellvibrionaceae bacterium]